MRTMLKMTKTKGWTGESKRHAKAARGIKTGRKSFSSTPIIKLIPKKRC